MNRFRHAQKSLLEWPLTQIPPAPPRQASNLIGTRTRSQVNQTTKRSIPPVSRANQAQKAQPEESSVQFGSRAWISATLKSQVEGMLRNTCLKA
ncbi:MAG: hypothetical protein CMQ14_10570 [Gammaproteobacteria bacterium]|nr:hypothetical protein [Gammaproteobacteria bacterium]